MKRRLLMALLVAVSVHGCGDGSRARPAVAVDDRPEPVYATGKGFEHVPNPRAESPWQQQQKAKEEGRKALEKWDQVINDEAAGRRQRLQKASVKHTMSNRAGVRLDYYHLRSGKVVICTTSVPKVGAPNFSCDGDV